MRCGKCGAELQRDANFCIKCGTKIAKVAPRGHRVEYETVVVHVAGVTFKNGRKSRQAILRRIRWRDDEFASNVHLELRSYEFEGRPAIGVYANDQQIGNVPASQVQYILDNQFRVEGGIADFQVVGGGTSQSGDELKYGAQFILRMKIQ